MAWIPTTYEANPYTHQISWMATTMSTAWLMTAALVARIIAITATTMMVTLGEHREEYRNCTIFWGSWESSSTMG